MERNKALKKISGDSVMIDAVNQPHPTICKTIGGATYVARIHFDKASKMRIDDKMIRLMEMEISRYE